MRLTYLTDYSLRVLMYAGAMPRRLVTIQEIAKELMGSRKII